MDGAKTLATCLSIAAVSLGLIACERPATTPDIRPDAALEKPSSPEIEGVNLQELVTQAQALRDREFAEPPAISPTTDSYKNIPPDAVRADRKAILFGLFGQTDPFDDTVATKDRIAWWDAGENVVKYRTGNDADAATKKRSILFALLRGLDAIHGTEAPAPASWDAYLAEQALRVGPPYLATATALAQERRADVSLADVAYHPAVVVRLPLRDAMFTDEDSLEAQAASFVDREGFGLAAAMYRASGWSGVEMLWHDRPESTAWVVRPDRFLAGDALGEWEWPKIPTQIREEAGWKVDRQGRIGPAVTALFLGTVVEPARARTVYVTWQTDTYRAWRRGDDWIFEWITNWNTPTAAEQFVEVAPKALDQQERAGRFRVVRRGVTVAIVGTSDPDGNLDPFASSALTMQPKFTPRAKGMITFKPTPVDAAAAALEEADLGDNRWSDPATGLSVDVTPFAGWDIRRVNELALRWFAKRDGSIVEFSTELPDPLAPELSEDAWKEWVIEGFRESAGKLDVVEAQRADISGRPGWIFVFDMEIEGTPSRLLMHQFVSEPDAPSGTPRVVTYSLQAKPEAFDEVRKTFESAEIVVTPAGDPEANDPTPEAGPDAGP